MPEIIRFAADVGATLASRPKAIARKRAPALGRESTQELTTTATGTQIVGIFDILRESWALPPSVLGSLSPGQMLGYDGTALYFRSNAPLLPTDLNGQVPDVYRVEARGIGIFGGGWQGGFE